MQKAKPSLRTAGATSAGNRPKTAPIPLKERWNTKDKVRTDKSEKDISGTLQFVRTLYIKT